MIPSIEAAHITAWVYPESNTPRTFRVDMVLAGTDDDIGEYREPYADEVWFASWDQRVGQDGLLQPPPPRTLSELLDDSVTA